MEVLDDDADEHVEHEEADKQQERDEVEKAPLVVVALRLQRHASHTPQRRCRALLQRAAMLTLQALH